MTHDEIRRLILQTIQDNQSNPGISVHDSVIAEKTGLSVQEVQDHLEVLEEEKSVQLAITTGGHGAWLTSRGRLCLQDQVEPLQAKSLATTSTDTIQRLVLGAIAEGQGRNVRDSEITEKTGLDLQVVRDHLDLLAEEDMLVASKTLDGTRQVRLKPRGRLILETKPVITEPRNSSFPIEIQESLLRFRVDHPDEAKVAFIMMRFGETGLHEKVLKGIKSALEPHAITGLRADDKQYHDDLFDNILTYIYGCGLGIAVLERIETDDFNPNVSLEIGYMMAIRKPVCLLKDKTLRSLQSDLVGRLYKPFDPQDPIRSIPPVLHKWLADKQLSRTRI
jgi:transcription initiation factor IIE alpha subunit